MYAKSIGYIVSKGYDKQASDYGELRIRCRIKADYNRDIGDDRRGGPKTELYRTAIFNFLEYAHTVLYNEGMTDQSPLPPLPQKNLEAFQALLEIDEKERNFKMRQKRQTAYLLSVLLPPIGLYYFFKFMFFSNMSPDDVKAAWISLGLTIGSLCISVWSLGLLFGQGSIQNAVKSDTLKQFVTPENMQQFKDLMQ